MFSVCQNESLNFRYSLINLNYQLIEAARIHTRKWWIDEENPKSNLTSNECNMKHSMKWILWCDNCKNASNNRDVYNLMQLDFVCVCFLHIEKFSVGLETKSKKCNWIFMFTIIQWWNIDSILWYFANDRPTSLFSHSLTLAPNFAWFYHVHTASLYIK